MHWLVFFFLISSSLLSAYDAALLKLGKWEAEVLLKKTRRFSLYTFLTQTFFSSNAWEGFRYCIKTSKYSFRLLFAIYAFIDWLKSEQAVSYSAPQFIKTVILIILVSFITDCIFTLLAYKFTSRFLRVIHPLACVLLLPLLPLASLGFFVLRFFEPEIFKQKGLTQRMVSQKIRQLIEESGLIEFLDVHDRRLLSSLVNFKDAIAREVMVPRIDVFSLPAETTLIEASVAILREGYSRIPVYKDSVDDIIGVLLYKDVLNIYARSQEDLEAKAQLQRPIEEFIKPVLYSPETKKISHLLQEFRNKQMHLAIVVDEWGGTEGIVTIEDILEELVGEIADEYDSAEEMFYTAVPSGGWIVDAKMSIKDIEEELGISIPTSPEYDTLGGYIFHKAGAIPSNGWKIHHDRFDLEVLSSNERAIEKIHIKPTSTKL